MPVRTCWRHAAAILLMLCSMPAQLFAEDLAGQIEVCDHEQTPALQRRAACSTIIANPAATPIQRADALVNRGSSFDDDRDFGRAIADFTAAIALNPKDASAFLLRGNSHDANGDLDKALADYNSAIGLDPHDASGYFNRATVYQAKGDMDRAIADYQKALEIDGSHEGAKEGLAELATPRR